MCDLLVRIHDGRGGCGHAIAYGYQRCQAAFQRPGRHPCVPPSGRMRDLPRASDLQDRHVEGRCAVCKGETPPSSEGSEVLEII